MTKRITCCVCLLIVALFAAGCEQLQKKPQKKPGLAVGYSGKPQSWLFSNEFNFKIWHHYPGTVHNGVVRMRATGTYVNGGEPVLETFSFDAWPPNEENARTFKFEIDRLGPDLQICLDVSIQAKEIAESDVFVVWVNSGWDEEAREAAYQRRIAEILNE